ncbi:MAG: efflux RND transporter periplasmic adaptor subunit [Thermodesulfobacteriota bacterium]
MSQQKFQPFFAFRRLMWGLLPVFLLVLAACGEKAAFTPPPPPQVTVSQPQKRQVTEYLELTGNTQAINTVQLRARVEGYLEKVLFHDGDRVKKGQLLFLIQQNTYQAKLQQAKADILTQKARLFHAQTELTRYSKLLKEKAASQVDVDNWLYQRDAAKAALLAAEAQRDLAQLNLDYTRVTSPFDGRIDRRLRDPGNLVGSGESTVLSEVNQIAPIYIYFTVNERDLLRLMGGTRLSPEEAGKKKWPMSFGLANDQGYPHGGTLDFAAISVTSTTGTLLMRGISPNKEGKVMPGLYARVRVPVGEKKAALVVPMPALGFDQQGPYVLVVNDQNLVERRSVTLGTQVDGFRVIDEGLQGNEWVVVEGVLKAIPGRPVTPEKKGEPKTPPAKDKSAAKKNGKRKAGS